MADSNDKNNQRLIPKFNNSPVIANSVTEITRFAAGQCLGKAPGIFQHALPEKNTNALLNLMGQSIEFFTCAF